MRKPRKYPTLLDLMRRGRQAAMASSGAIAMLATGCPAPEEQIAGGLQVPDVTETPDAVEGMDATDATVVNLFDPGGIVADLPFVGLPDVPVVEPDVPVVEPDLPITEPDLPLAGGMPMPDPEPVPDVPAPGQEDAP